MLLLQLEGNRETERAKREGGVSESVSGGKPHDMTALVTKHKIHDYEPNG